MTDESRRENIRADIQRGEEALRSAAVLISNRLNADAISRAYYGMLYHARALLLTEGLEARTHGGVNHYLHLHFVRPGHFPPEQARAFARMQADREDADYESSAIFTDEQVTEVMAAARAFCEACRRLLAARDYPDR